MGDETSRSRPALEASDLTIGYAPDRLVISGLTFSLTGPGIVRLDAPNGSGKSTLIEAASGYLRPFAGSILVDGVPAQDPAVRARRRVCRATPALHPHLSLLDHLALAADLAGVGRDEPLDRARAFGLDRWFGTRTSALSTGTARRLWYLICTTGRFSVALLDEPFNGVDAESTEQMVVEMERWAEDALLIVVSHAVPPGLRTAETLPLEARGEAVQ
ncbi:ATP-binding cassette domain-containing protein [Rathayibacter sp. VKM Ac-2927]|uniref:ABC transporter ATP-binding protein n=1 Tax=Rathayibacter sp. VKM Ac-2927 TaxID=2929478 RepID=UPI001FB226A6|nr:ATP-binding cassette domain-containing protein [Rathayibacter sp. VKM Ac-2927]MCJ1685524.1 ATP-binding cassette domain-containing protein [Rathayibacter sp. VKM Ac-2927]